MATVTAPVADFEGEVIGVTFKKGVAETSDNRALAYFGRHGYGIDGSGPRPAPEPADPRLIGEDGDGIEPVGTKLRDAAVDPKPEDYLPPTNAGEANPHGPEVISPEIHGSEGVRPVRPGDVPEAPAQEPAETAHAVELTEPELVQPKGNGTKAEWVEWAVAHGVDRTGAEAATVADLKGRSYGSVAGEG